MAAPEFVADRPAMKLGKRVVVADLHLGIETEYWKAGFKIFSHMEKMAEELNIIAEQAKAREIVINGDFKNSIAFPSKREEKYIPAFFDTLSYPVTIIKGNHDGRIEDIVGNRADVAGSIKAGKWLLTHGHKNEEWGHLIIGHNHPVVEIRDMLGSVYRERVWVFGRKQIGDAEAEIIVMPAFNPLAGGHALPDLQGIASGMEIERVVLLDGLEIGRAWEIPGKSTE